MSSTTNPPITAKMQQALEDTKKTSAALRTFGVVELLERVLQDLEVKDLVTVTRVCKNWKDLVDSSPVLQEITFKRAAPITEVLYTEGQSGRWKLTTDTSMRSKLGSFTLAELHPLLSGLTVLAVPNWELSPGKAWQLMQNKSFELVFATQPPCETWVVKSDSADGFEPRFLHPGRQGATIHELSKAAFEEMCRDKSLSSVVVMPLRLVWNDCITVKQARKAAEIKEDIAREG